MAAKTAKVSKLNSGRTNNGPSNVDATSLHVSLPQMLDLALGTPEVGTVNLNILHNFLHVLLYQVNLRTTKVEYRGEDANRIKTVVASLKTGPSLHLHEYNIVDGSGRIKHRINSTDDLTVNVDVYTEAEEKSPSPGKSGKHGKPAASAPTTARGKTAKEQGSDTSLEVVGDLHGLPGAKKTRGVKQHIGAGQEGEDYRQSIIFVEPIVDGAAPTVLGFKRLEDTVKQLQQRFQALEELANDPEMIERVKTNSTDPLSDMWHIININKRLDATEQGVDKLTKMLHELIKSDKTEIVGDRPEAEARPDEISKQLTDIKQRLTDLEMNVDFLRHEEHTAIVRHTESDSNTALPGTDTGGTLEHGGSVENGDGRASSSTAQRKVSLGRVSVADMREDFNTLRNEMVQVRQDIVFLNSKVDQLQGGGRAPPNSDGVAADEGQIAVTGKESIGSKNSGSENDPEEAKMSRCLDAIHNVEAMYGDALHELNDRMQELEKAVSCLMETVNSGPMAGVGPEGSQGLNELFNKIQGIQADVEHLNQTASRLLDERENRETHTHALLEQIELLKTVKADKEELEDALADKADAQAINRKVSYDQFDAVCDDLARGLEDAITKLSQQESIWQQALDEVQREIESKLDKVEISPLKDFVNNKLKTLQQKLKILSELKRESEAAGTKKMLRDVQCLSCDKDVVMKMQEGPTYRAEALPCTKSMKPYLTYELDQIRKQQRRLPHGRNMIQYEAAIHEETKKLKSARDDTIGKSPRDHLCNRYCGGSHTVTTPQQRVMRMGHFLTQWGPEAVQLTEGIIRGTDGQTYRGRPVLEKLDVCGPCGGESRVTSAPTETEAPDAHRTSQLNLRRGSITSQKRPSARKVPVVNETVLQTSTIQESIVEETQQSAPVALEAKASEEKRNRGKSNSESLKAVEEIVPAVEERPPGDDGAEEEEGGEAKDE